MKRINQFVTEFETIILNYKKVYVNRRPLQLKTLGLFLVLLFIVAGVGYIFDVLYKIDYLLFMTNILVFVPYFFYKYMDDQIYKKEREETYHTRDAISLELLYVLVILFTASAFLAGTVFRSALSLFTIIFFLILFLGSTILYAVIYKKFQKIEMETPFDTFLNGLLIGVLFYAMTALIHINTIPLSFVVVGPVIYVLCRVKQYVMNRYVIRIKRVAILSFGFLLVLLSFPFTRAFNYASFYRSEFTLRMVYDAFKTPVMEFEPDVMGDVVFYEDYIIIATEDKIIFYDQELNEVSQMNNLYSKVYVQNDRLFANMLTNPFSPYIELYEYNGTEFVSQGEFYVLEETDEVNLSTDTYVNVYGDIYARSPEMEDYVLIDNTEEVVNVIEQTDDFISFSYARTYLADSTSFRDDVKGAVYQSIAYHNNHMVFLYANTFIKHNPTYVVPEDNGKVMLYLTEASSYLDDISQVPVAYEIPNLFKIQNFYFVNDMYYLTGYIEYTTGGYNYMVLAINEAGELVEEILYDGPEISISDDYMAFGNEQLKLYSFDADVMPRCRIIEGYGLMFFTLTMVVLFGLDPIKLGAKERKDISF